MRLLLDTHVLIWAFEDDLRLSKAARGLILDGGNLIYYSDASVWEIALKRLAHPGDAVDEREFDGLCQSSGFRRIPMRKEHIFRASEFPLVHRDPFDRMLMAQADVERMALVTHDKNIARYGLAFVQAV